jgi:hypothetical protein
VALSRFIATSGLLSRRAESSFNILEDDDPALGCSPLLRGITGVISYIDQQGEIGLTKAGAFNRMLSIGRRRSSIGQDIAKMTFLPSTKS